MELRECIKKGFIKKTVVNSNLINSLIQMSMIKENTVRKAKLDEENISVYLSVAYDALREILESLCISKGYKVVSHVCLGELLRDLFTDFNYSEFNRCRWIRNSINYYGEKVDLEQGKELIKKIFKLKDECLLMLKK
jgi:uncharacterized protein (UPF0332 family)